MRQYIAPNHTLILVHDIRPLGLFIKHRDITNPLRRLLLGMLPVIYTRRRPSCHHFYKTSSNLRLCPLPPRRLPISLLRNMTIVSILQFSLLVDLSTPRTRRPTCRREISGGWMVRKPKVSPLSLCRIIKSWWVGAGRTAERCYGPLKAPRKCHVDNTERPSKYASMRPSTRLLCGACNHWILMVERGTILVFLEFSIIYFVAYDV